MKILQHSVVLSAQSVDFTTIIFCAFCCRGFGFGFEFEFEFGFEFRFGFGLFLDCMMQIFILFLFFCFWFIPHSLPPQKILISNQLNGKVLRNQVPIRQNNHQIHLKFNLESFIRHSRGGK